MKVRRSSAALLALFRSYKLSVEVSVRGSCWTVLLLSYLTSSSLTALLTYVRNHVHT
jgi:hypothetical protein